MSGKQEVAARVAALRHVLLVQNLAGFLIPHADCHQNEYLPPDQERLLWISGFSGSAGLAMIMRDKAALFVDGRYTLQAAEQTDTNVFTLHAAGKSVWQTWLRQALVEGDRLGFDPWLHTQDFVTDLSALCEDLGANIVALDKNPVDSVWPNRPAPTSAPITLRPLSLAGESVADKLTRLRACLEADALLISDPHNVAWLFNIRGADVAYTPLPLAFALVPREGKAQLFIALEKLTPPVVQALSPWVMFHPPSELSALAGRRVIFDKATAPFKLIDAFRATGGLDVLQLDPITLMKAVKNPVEIARTKAAHIRDGVAFAKFLSWFEDNALQAHEIDAALALEGFRAEDTTFRDLSFPTISAAGAHAALPHYRVSEHSNSPISAGFYLIDSGGQYDEGTTDITRTLSVGDITPQMCDRYTRVLKGHIAVASALFPKGTTGAQIDSFARRALWDVGLDFDHGTGHGVGVYLSVHEGPQRLSATGTVALQAGMIVSNEPAYYCPGHFGIRIENLLLVVPKTIAGAEREMLGFETISYAPIDTRPLVQDLLTEVEMAWLKNYHAQVYSHLAPHLRGQTLTALQQTILRRGLL